MISHLNGTTNTLYMCWIEESSKEGDKKTIFHFDSYFYNFVYEVLDFSKLCEKIGFL
jgi:hypothetical protein